MIRPLNVISLTPRKILLHLLSWSLMKVCSYGYGYRHVQDYVMIILKVKRL